MENTPRWHNLVWDDEKIGRFWNFVSEREPWRNEFFSKQVGAGVMNLLKDLVPMKGDALDYGCGSGDMLQHLLAAGMRCEGIDFSANNVEAVNRRFQGHRDWKGASTHSGVNLTYPDAHFDLVTCLETLEHVLPEKVPTLIADLRRVLKPKTGVLFVTVPHSEKLVDKNVYCPECGSVFHPYQHLCSFTVDSLEKLIAGFGFRTLLCDKTNFAVFQRKGFAGILDWSLRETYRWLWWVGATLMDAVCSPGTPPGGRVLRQRLGSGIHLFWLGTRDERIT
ncbi:MAG TPA: class I SAM-dependent methyltransferase [Syntrophales bacterium]|nr:class I SAM-dependent methyltransferase [Syntrophales bacterium]